MERCEVQSCRAEPAIDYLGHGLCEPHWDQLTGEQASPDALRDALGLQPLPVLPMEETIMVPKAGASRGKRTGKPKAATKEKSTKQADPKQENVADNAPVVFAFRLGKAERDRIHQAAGSGRATRFVRAAALAAADGDAKAFEQLVEQAQANLK